MTKTQIIRHIMDAANLFIRSGVCPFDSREFPSWFKFTLFCHNHGYLYVGIDEGKVDFAAIGYRVPSIDENTGKTLPEQESGDILFVPVLASISKDKLKLKKMLNAYLNINQDVKEIYYHHRADMNKPRRFVLRRKDVRTEETVAS